MFFTDHHFGAISWETRQEEAISLAQHPGKSHRQILSFTSLRPVSSIAFLIAR